MNKERDGQFVTLEHGSGGALSRELVEKIIYPCFGGEAYPELSDSTRFEISGPGCLTTDSYTVDPPFFPGSDIGRLAVFGTCNDLAVAGAKPRFLTLALIIEEGFPFVDLERVLGSVRDAAKEAGVTVLTGDTKVVPRGRGGGIYINTSGIGELVAAKSLSTKAIQAGDEVIVSGPVGAHGIAVMAAREKLSVGSEIRSDCAHLFPLCRPLLELGGELRFMRDATRGGLAAVLGEAALDSGLGMEISEKSIPIDDAVSAVAEILGLYPLEIANEGVFIAIVSHNATPRALAALRGESLGARAAVIGAVVERHPGVVALETEIGGRRVLGLPRGLLLPRIC
jgi:hydrogenase expression/formation protein HypE